MNLHKRVAQLEAAVVALGVAEFGDVEGHPFHGNQWTGGSGGWESTVGVVGFGQRVTETGHTLRAAEGGSWQVADPSGKVIAAGPSGGKQAAERAYAGKSLPSDMVKVERERKTSQWARHEDAGYQAGRTGQSRMPADLTPAEAEAWTRGHGLGMIDRATANSTGLEDSERTNQLARSLNVPYHRTDGT